MVHYKARRPTRLPVRRQCKWSVCKIERRLDRDGMARVSVVNTGGRTAVHVSQVEKLYVVLDCALNVSNGQVEVTLGRRDSCRIAPVESRRLRNDAHTPVTCSW